MSFLSFGKEGEGGCIATATQQNYHKKKNLSFSFSSSDYVVLVSYLNVDELRKFAESTLENPRHRLMLRKLTLPVQEEITYSFYKYAIKRFYHFHRDKKKLVLAFAISTSSFPFNVHNELFEGGVLLTLSEFSLPPAIN